MIFDRLWSCSFYCLLFEFGVEDCLLRCFNVFTCAMNARFVVIFVFLWCLLVVLWCCWLLFWALWCCALRCVDWVYSYYWLPFVWLIDLGFVYFCFDVVVLVLLLTYFWIRFEIACLKWCYSCFIIVLYRWYITLLFVLLCDWWKLCVLFKGLLFVCVRMLVIWIAC